MFSFPLEPQVRGPVEPEPETNIQQNPQNPQIETTQQESEDDSEGVVVIPIDRSFSDGDPSTWPTEERFGRPDDTNYRQKLAELWLRKTGAYEPGVTYIIDELPGGYVLFDRPRGSNPAIRDRFLWGHPIGGTTKCRCQLCAKLERRQKGTEPRTNASYSASNQFPDAAIGARRGRPPRSGRPVGRPSGTPSELDTPRRPPGRPTGSRNRPVVRGRGRPSGLRRPGRPPGKLGTIICDNEGTPDVFKFAVTKLKQLGELDNDISEPQSMDWRAERAGMEEYLETLDMRPSYLPRLGELVLWAPNFKGELLWNQKTQSVQIYSPKGKWLEKPRWRAGVVGQIPTEETVLQDLVESTGKKWGLNYSGFRVETLPDPNGSDKSYSLHYGYVPLKCIKPFNAFEYFLQGTPREQLHPSIEHAMTVMSSFNLVDKHRFKGVWPNASIYSRGIFIGAEFLTVGDAIRLKPKGHNAEAIAQNPPIVDVMLINDIRLDLTECDADLKSKHLAEKYDVRISGRVFTTNVERAQTDNNGQPVRPLSLHDVLDVFNTGGMSGYGEWYEIHPGSTVDISQDMVLGRCYEPDAMKLLFNTRSLAYDINGILSARKYSRQVDERIPEGKRWFWGDFRTQTLGIDSLNGEDVGHYSETRDVKMWRANLRIVDGTASQADLKAAKHPAERGRPSIKPQLAEVSKMSKLVSAGLGAVDTSNPVSETDEESSDEVEVARRNRSMNRAREETNGGNNGKEESEESEESEPESFTTRIEELRGGTEETEGGDYVPDNEDEPNSKRSKHSFQVDFGTAGQ